MQYLKLQLEKLDNLTLSKPRKAFLKKAIIDEMASRCARQYILKEKAKCLINRKPFNNKLKIIRV